MMCEGKAVKVVGDRLQFHDKVKAFDIVLDIGLEAAIRRKGIGDLAFHHSDQVIAQPYFVAGIDHGIITDDRSVDQSVHRSLGVVAYRSQVSSGGIGLQRKSTNGDIRGTVVVFKGIVPNGDAIEGGTVGFKREISDGHITIG